MSHNKNEQTPVELRTTPHLHSAQDVVDIMRNVVYAILPIAGWSIWQFGLSALLLLLSVSASCLLTERFFNYTAGQPNTLGDYSAVITGLLLALSLPPPLFHCGWALLPVLWRLHWEKSCLAVWV